MLVLGVALVHAWLLDAVHPSRPAPRRVTRVPPMLLSSIAVAAAPSLHEPLPATDSVPVRAHEAAASHHDDRPPAIASSSAPDAGAASKPTDAAAAMKPVPAAAPAPEASASAAIASETGDIEVPVYPTRLPPPARWTYGLDRQAGNGRAVLHWQPEGDRYTARFEGNLRGQLLFVMNSAGMIDGAGIAPERFVDRRRGRSTQAANFQREAGKITFSGPSVERPLPAGAQDRLTWMVQLAGVVAAEPARWQPGQKLLLYVSGARGGAEVWTFLVYGMEAVDTPAGRSAALRLLREPARPYDTRAEVWLGPAQHYMPLRATILSGETRTEYTLIEASEP